ncbi:MAG TPA: hypothetical protein VE443_07530 [Beijerinckiaceae bacterium]|jgi:hypothetical protein|nr:hypothetical protein [Microvirga sp.]HZB37836.1 hypothetical protein [Beijerinckiaceae bacterium]
MPEVPRSPLQPDPEAVLAGEAHRALPGFPAGLGAVHPQSAAAVLLALVGVAAGIVFAWALGALPVGLYSADYQFLSEGAARVALGQVPHADFPSPLGPLSFWLLWLARKLPGLGPDAFAVNTLAWVLVALPVTAVAARLRTLPQAALLVGLAALLTVAPFTLEAIADACDVNYNGAYNRSGAALLLTTFVAGMVPPRSSRAEAPILAWILAVLFLLKVTFFLAALAFLCVAAVFSAERRRALAGALVLLAVAALGLEAATGLPSAYMRDMAVMARLGGGDMLPRLWSTIATYPLALSLAGALVAALAWQGAARPSGAGDGRLGRLRAFEAPVLGAACMALTVWSESQSTGSAGLVALAALLFIPALDRHRSHARIAIAAGLLVATAGVFAEQALRRGRCVLADAPQWQSHPALDAAAPGFRASPSRLTAAEIVASLWRDHRAFADTAYRGGYSFGLDAYGAPVAFAASAILVFEAVARLRELGLDRGLRHVTSITTHDEFTPALGLEPAKGLTGVLDPLRSLGPLTGTQAAAYLRPADAVFERTCALAPWNRWLVDVFRPALVDFDPVVLTPCWTVHVRRSPGSGDASRR